MDLLVIMRHRKHLKARLQEAKIGFPKTHNLAELLDLVLRVEPLWEALREASRALTDHAIEFRYPGGDAGAAQAQRARHPWRMIRQAARQSSGLEVGQPELGVRETAAVYRAGRRRK